MLYPLFSLFTKPGVSHIIPISDTGLTKGIPRITLHVQNGIITQQTQSSSFWNQLPELTEKKDLFYISYSREFFRGKCFFLTKIIVPHWRKFAMCGYFSPLPQISRRVRWQQAIAIAVKAATPLESLQSADVSTDSENKQLAFCTAEASCVNKTEFELLHAAVTSVKAEEGSTWLWPRACG